MVTVQLLALLGAFALLVRNTAAGLAGGLARGLALAAAAVLGALAHVAGLKRLDSLHNRYLHFSFRFDRTESTSHISVISIAQNVWQVKQGRADRIL